jgi:ABC-type polysaccharide/polyol phosphate transport system ATPase subunit
MTAISVENVGKKFKRVSLRKNYTTLKSMLSDIFRKKEKSNGGKTGEFKALDGVSFNIAKGEAWGIIGCNGSGKSTLLKLIAGIYKPDTGNLTIDGRVSALIELGAGFHPEFSGRENIFINASILGMSKKQILEKFDEIVSFAELEDFIDNPVRTYSSGMFMRLGFSVAIHADPDILLVDEVLAVGDEGFSRKCKDKINGFKKAGKTIVVVTHNMGDVTGLCNKAVWLENGTVKEIGPPKRVVDAYLTTVAESENEKMLEQTGVATVEEETSVNRWGTREAEIKKVTMRGADGAERYVFQTGDSVLVDIEYMAHVPLKVPVFGVAIHKQDGSQCYGTNTHIEDIEIEKIEGAGKVSMLFDRLDLVQDSYTLSVAVHAEDGHPYDYHDQMYHFSVRSLIKDGGVFRPPHKWTIDGKLYNGAKSGDDI